MKYFFIRIIQTLFFVGALALTSMGQATELSIADSLFAHQKYTEALKKYEEVFNLGQASPAMLTKMAFIQEGLGNYANALYYLHLYYQQTSDKAAMNKMRELATEHGLEGYEYTDMRYFAGFVRKYQMEIISVLLAFSLFLLAYSYRKRREGELPRVSIFLQVVTLLLVAVVSNQMFLGKNAIVSRDHSLLMTGPSAGAEPMDFIDKGNKVAVIKSDELWTKIKWGEQDAYIRTKNLKVL